MGIMSAITHAKKNLNVVICGTYLSTELISLNCHSETHSCKEGLNKPPKKQVRPETTAGAKQSIVSQNRSAKEPNKNKQKPYAVLADIENRHAGAQVEKGLKVKSGQSIRLHCSPTGQLVARQTEDIMNQDGAEDSERLNDKEVFIYGVADRITSGGENSVLLSESDYSDPEMDSAIRTLPMDDDQIEVQSTVLRDEELRLVGSKKRKVPLFLEEPEPPQKRVKFLQDAAVEQERESDYIEVLGVSPVSSANETLIQSNTMELDTDVADELAELDEWLNSGAVDIV
ncbi:hypothetical protein AX15_006341 [Amanita polypyramis BW_CC]|nr:hypothetical protein AX15_006341 [Amanita polypyramis BW_CC]